MVPAMVVRYNMGWMEMILIDFPLFALATVSVFRFYLTSQREAHADWISRVRYLPAVMAIGIGLAVNNTRALFEALFGEPGEFTRTPKYGIERAQDDWQHKKYHQSMPVQPFVEIALGLYFTVAILYALSVGIYATLPFLALFQFGFLYMGLMSILQQIGGDDLFVKAPQMSSGK
jgi:hypothetical protein